MTTTHPHHRTHHLRTDWSRWPGLVASAALAGAVGLVVLVVSDMSYGSWYNLLVHPSVTPPGWVFRLAWPPFYGLLAFAAWRVHSLPPSRRREVALIAYGAQLALNLGWALVFFVLHWTWGGVAFVLAQLLAIVAAIKRFKRVDHTASLLLWPCAAWVWFLGVLTLSLAAMN